MEEYNGAPMMFNGWVPADELQGLNEANCVAPYYAWTNKNYSRLDSGSMISLLLLVSLSRARRLIIALCLAHRIA
jgi:hypothetical protein